MRHAGRQIEMAAIGVLVVSLWFLCPLAAGAQASPQGTVRTYAPQKLNLTVGKSLVIAVWNIPPTDYYSRVRRTELDICPRLR